MPEANLVSIATILIPVVAILAPFLILHEWQFRRLSWRHVNLKNCRRYLVKTGWKEPWQDIHRPKLDKGDLHIVIRCIASDPATKGAVQMASDFEKIDKRHIVVIAPGVIEPGLTEEMLGRNVSVISYKQLGEIESILRDHFKFIAQLRRSDQKAASAI